MDTRKVQGIGARAESDDQNPSGAHDRESATFPGLLRRYRLDARLTQEALADKAGLAIRTIQALERGLHYPHRDSLHRLILALGIEGERRAGVEAAARPRPRRPTRTTVSPVARTSRVVFLTPSGPPTLEDARTNLPASWSSFVGRETDIREVGRLLHRARLVTLTGTGGVGKTRLALEVVAGFCGTYGDGIWLVDLASLADPALVPEVVSHVLGLRATADQPIVSRLLNHLRSRRVLLVLDNCEHLIDACAEVIHLVLAACPNVSILTTSREPMRLRGEHVYRVPSLPTPAMGRPSLALDLSRYDATRLFIERAFEGSGFTLTDANAAAVARICRDLDGIPLALELAAARMSALTAEEIASHLDQGFRQLAVGDRAALPRQKTMQATIDWSYDLLTKAEKDLWRRLAVFVGGFTLEAAEVVGDVTNADLVARLVDKSLVTRDDRSGAARYRLLEPLRQYAEEKLTEAGDADRTRDRHADWCLELTGDGEAAYYGPGQVAWTARIALEIANIRAALGWCLEHDVARGLQLARNLGLFWMTSGLDPEGQRWYEALLVRASEDSPARAWALYCAGLAARDLGDYSTATVRLRESLEMATRVGDHAALSWAQQFLGTLFWERENFAEARALIDASVGLARQIGNHPAMANALITSYHLARYQGDFARAQLILDEYLADDWVRSWEGRRPVGLRLAGMLAYSTGNLLLAKELLEDSIAGYGQIVDRPGLGMALEHLGYVLGELGEQPSAEMRLRESLFHFQDMGHRPRAAESLHFLGLAAIREGNHGRGTTLLAAAEATAGLFRATLDPSQRAARDSRLAEARRTLGMADFDGAWTTGSRMTFDQAVAFALAVD